jgi:hypothetical protein
MIQYPPTHVGMGGVLPGQATSPYPAVVFPSSPGGWSEWIPFNEGYVGMGQVETGQKPAPLQALTVADMKKDLFLLKKIIVGVNDWMDRRGKAFTRVVADPISKNFPDRGVVSYLQETSPLLVTLLNGIGEMKEYCRAALRKADAALYLANTEAPSAKPSQELQVRWAKVKPALDLLNQYIEGKPIQMGAAIITGAIAISIVIASIGLFWTNLVPQSIRAATGRFDSEEIQAISQEYKEMVLQWQAAGIQVNPETAMENFASIFRPQFQPIDPSQALTGLGFLAIAGVIGAIWWTTRKKTRRRRRSPARPRRTAAPIVAEPESYR